MDVCLRWREADDDKFQSHRRVPSRTSLYRRSAWWYIIDKEERGVYINLLPVEGNVDRIQVRNLGLEFLQPSVTE